MILGGDPYCLDGSDVRAVAGVCAGGDAALLVDAYGVSKPYFDALSEAGIRTAYIDDGFFYSTGYHARMRLPVDVVIDYRFGADEQALSELYQGSGTVVLAGPRFAPVDARFRGVARDVAADVASVLVTCGSTNPGGTLERMVRVCRAVFPDARIDVAVGRFARFDAGSCRHGVEGIPGRRGDDGGYPGTADASAEASLVRAFRGINDLAPLMRDADLVVSAAGTTLYELCAVGVPTVAVPIVDNQLANVRGYAERGCGEEIPHLGWTDEELVEDLRDMRPTDARQKFAGAMRREVPGDGAELIVWG